MDPDLLLILIGIILAILVVLVAIKIVAKLPPLNEVFWRWSPSKWKFP